MQGRLFPQNHFPSKNQEISITLRDGRTFAVCSKGQHQYLIDMARQRIIADILENGKVTKDGQINEEELKSALDYWCENVSPFAPMEWIMERMHPEDRKEWNAKYRFGGITRKSSQ